MSLKALSVDGGLDKQEQLEPCHQHCARASIKSCRGVSVKILLEARFRNPAETNSCKKGNLLEGSH